MPFYILFPVRFRKITGLLHGEIFLPMVLGEPIYSFRRYSFNHLVFLGHWEDSKAFETFKIRSPKSQFQYGWSLTLSLYRRWGKIKEIESATLYPRLSPNTNETVAVTLARLKLSELFRFAKWGKPVEKQVRDHKKQKLAFAAFRPFGNFFTFSIWESEEAMVGMVHGTQPNLDGLKHKEAMSERNRKDFHFEFTTLRCEILEKSGFEYSHF
ncbi:MAG: hypothetical protein O9301_07010 [Leptospira sp.]|nr:hypothetical protein [Leptospira sp.]